MPNNFTCLVHDKGDEDKNCLVSESNDCNICKILKEKSRDGRWCFEWLRHLKDFEASEKIVEQSASKDRQVQLMVDHTDDGVKHIRSRLATLQTQMVFVFSCLRMFYFGGYEFGLTAVFFSPPGK